MKTTDRSKWKNGNGEIIGFAGSIFLFFLIMVTIVSLMGATTRSQQLTVATYAAGRAAAVSQTYDLGTARARAVLMTMYDKELSDGESDEDESIWMNISAYSNEGAPINIRDNWEMGNLFTIELYQKAPVLFPFTSNVQSCKLTMMIEGKGDKKK